MHGKLTTTQWDGRVVTESRELVSHLDAAREARLLRIYPQYTDQTFLGFGGAVTESAAYVFSTLNVEEQQAFMDHCWGSNGLNYRFLRLSIDSCDFSLTQYEAMSDPSDRQLRTFSFAREEKYIIPFLRSIQAHCGYTPELFLSPWSPPAFMKTNGSRVLGGKLREDAYQFWADYVCRFISEYEKRGFRVSFMSIQNEPNATQVWDSCLYTAEEEAKFLRDYLYPTLQRNRLSHVQCLIFDHNKDRVFERTDTMMQHGIERMAAGVACHWYTGDHFESLSMIHRQYPDLLLCLSEFCEVNAYFPEHFEERKAFHYLHELIGDLNAGLNLIFDWNLLLDERGGPNHVGNFTGAPIMKDGDKLRVQMTWYALKHLSSIHPQAVRVGLSKFSDALEATAFRNSDGSYALLILNKGDAACSFGVCIGQEVIDVTLAERTMADLVLND